MKLERRLFYEQMLSNEMRGDVMKFLQNFESHQPNPSSCACRTNKMLMCAIRSQSHLIRNIVKALKFQPVKSSHLCSPATQKMKANAIFRLKPSSLKSAYNRNFVKTEIAAMLAVVSLNSVYFGTD